MKKSFQNSEQDIVGDTQFDDVMRQLLRAKPKPRMITKKIPIKKAGKAK